MDHRKLWFWLLVTSTGWSLGQANYQSILEAAYPAVGPGAVAIVARGDQVLFQGARGMANVELGVPLEVDSVFRLGSITKQFTAAAIMKLVDQGKLALSDPLTKFLPDYPGGDSVHVEHLLTHTSGIVSYTGIPGYMATEITKDLSVDQLIAVFKNLTVEFQPGSQFRYNNSGYILLGAIIEKVSGKTYAEYVEDTFFKPLEMNQSYYGSHSMIIPKRVQGYQVNDNEITNAPYLSMSQPYAAGSLLSTVGDLNKWNRALFVNGLLKKPSLIRMTSPYRLTDGSETSYGYGLAFGDIKGHKVISHGGGIHGFTTQATYLPNDDVFVALLSNGPGGARPQVVATELAALAVGDPFEKRVAVDLSSETLSKYVGVYQISENDQRKVILVENQLFTQRAGGPKSAILPFSDIGFFYPDSHTYLEFAFDDQGQVSGMNMHHGGSAKAEYAARSDEQVMEAVEIELAVEVLQRHVGVYELAPGFQLTVSLQDKQLMTQATGQPAVPAFATSEDEFFLKVVDAQLSFHQGEDGRSEKVVLHQGGQDMSASRVK